MAHNLYSKTKHIFDTIEQNYQYIPNDKYNSVHPSNDQDINQNKYFFQYNSKNNISSLNKDYNLKQNNERIIDLNESIKEKKDKIENILSPIRFEEQKNENKSRNYLKQLNQIKTIYTMTSEEIQNEIVQLKNKKNKLTLVYNSLYNFKQKLLNKEKEIKEKESKIDKYEKDLKVNENIVKNNLDTFNNYINYQTQNLINKFKNIKNYHEQKEKELNMRQQKINEYEIFIKNIIQQKEKEHKEKILQNINRNIGKVDAQNEFEKNEKSEQMKKDIEIIEKEKEKIEKEKELIQLQKEQILYEKEENEKIRKQNDNIAQKLKQKEIYINQRNKMLEQYSNIEMNFNNMFHTPIRDVCNYDNSTTIENFCKNNSFNNINSYNKKKSLTPNAFHSYKNRISNQNSEIYKNTKDDSFISYNNNHISNIKNNTIQLKDEKMFQKINSVQKLMKKNKNKNNYVHDNIYLLKNKMNQTSDNSNLFTRINSFIPIQRRYNSSRLSNEKMKGSNDSDFTNRTFNLVGNVSGNNTIKLFEHSNNKEKSHNLNDENKSKILLELKSNDYNDTCNDINKKIFEAEKALQLVKNQEIKIKMIKNKLDKKIKNSA